MKNWRTTLGGLAVGSPVVIDALINAYTAGAFNGQKGMQLFMGVAIIAWGAVQKDHNVTGGTKS